MAVYAGTYLTPEETPWLADTYGRTAPGKSNTAQVRRCKRVHALTTSRATQISRGVARGAWAALTPEARTAWKTGTVEAAFNRDNKNNGLRNGWIYFNRANFASQWYAGLSDRIHNEFPSWSLSATSLTNFSYPARQVTFNFTANKGAGNPRVPRLFVYQNHPGRKAPPLAWKNTKLMTFFDGITDDLQVVHLTLNWQFDMYPGFALTVITRVATDAGYGQTQYLEIEAPPT
jgi:hypothetical protein